MPATLKRSDFKRLVEIVANHPDFATETDRLRLLQAAFGGIEGAGPILTGPNLSGSPRSAAVESVDFLTHFGSLDGRHSLSLLLDQLRSTVGDDRQQAYMDLMAELDRLALGQNTVPPLPTRPRQEPDKGFAIGIAKLPRVYPPEVEEPADEYGAEVDAPLAKILDHTDQLAPICDLLSDDAGDRAIALFDACSEDWPSYLADHIHLQPWPDAAGDILEAVSLRLTRFDGEALWQALIDELSGELPGARYAPGEAGRMSAVRDWINGARLRVLYVPVVLKRQGRHLPEIIRGAHATLAKLGDFAPGSRVLVLFACVRACAKPPIWWWLYARLRLARLGCCRIVGAMRPLEKPDVDDWHAGFPRPLRAFYDRDRLKSELLALFADGGSIRYDQARRLLVDEGALRRARIET